MTTGFKGRDFLIKIEDAESSGVFVTIGQLTTSSYTVSNSEEQGTNKDSLGVEELLEGVSTQSRRIQGEGIADFGVGLTRLRSVAENEGGSNHANFQLLDAAGNKIQGRFQISEYSETGETAGAVTYSLTLVRSGSSPRTVV